MDGPRNADLLLFVAGVPGEADELELQSALVRWFLGTHAEVRLEEWRHDRNRRTAGEATPGGPSLPEEQSWHLPREMVAAVDLVCESASRVGRHVTLVDVNRPGIHRDLVRRWVGENDVFPLLIRADGTRLEGMENFTAHRLRTFVTGP